MDDLETAAYDPKGNLYIAAENFLFSWVDGYAPGKTVRFLRINKDIHHPISMTTDPDGDLYVGNHGVLGHNVVMFMPSRGSADLTITDVSYPSDLVFAQGRLYVADSDKNQVRVYRILPRERKAILSWIISSGLHGPSQLSYNMHGRLWVLNKPFAGADEVREYRIAMDNEPVYIRSIKERRHYINAVATNPSNEDVYVAEVPLFGNPKSVISTYDRYGTFRYEVAIADLPHSIVSSPTRYYSASRFQAAMYADKSLESVLDLPGNCEHPYKLAMMQPSP
ncbi:MAG TPA: hypothetical protein VGZ06_00080 [Candidatus Cybelea sp.]|nr:hypothetical protein [Candidatus Cybelea sp.]